MEEKISNTGWILLLLVYISILKCFFFKGLKEHLEKADQDINYYIPAEDFNGLAVIDWEYWRPQWARNWNTKDVYRQKSRKLISDMQENVSATDIEYLAKATFEESAKAFMKETIELGIKSRPKGLWGYYLYPDCHNYNVYAPNYTGSCPEEEVLRNNELSWLWNSSAALYPSIGVRKSLEDNENILRFSRFRVHESLRISTMTSHDYALPIFVYTRLGYRNEPLFFLSKVRHPLQRWGDFHPVLKRDFFFSSKIYFIYLFIYLFERQRAQAGRGAEGEGEADSC